MTEPITLFQVKRAQNILLVIQYVNPVLDSSFQDVDIIIRAILSYLIAEIKITTVLCDTQIQYALPSTTGSNY